MKLSPALPPCPRPPTLLTSSPPNGAARAAEAGLGLVQELASPALQEALRPGSGLATQLCKSAARPRPLAWA